MKNKMSAWSDENAIRAFEYGFNIPAHKIQLGQEFANFRYNIIIPYIQKISKFDL